MILAFGRYRKVFSVLRVASRRGSDLSLLLGAIRTAKYRINDDLYRFLAVKQCIHPGGNWHLYAEPLA
jgi:hypothetical protein